jgi:hypothetical protein
MHEGLKVIGIMCLIAAIIVLFMWLTIPGCCAGAQSVPVYVVSKYEGRLLELERAAIDDAFRAKISQLWQVWMSDDRGQPARAVAGAAQARKAYIASMTEIERREEENKKR